MSTADETPQEAPQEAPQDDGQEAPQDDVQEAPQDAFLEDDADDVLNTDDDGSLIDPPVIERYEREIAAAQMRGDAVELQMVQEDYDEARRNLVRRRAQVEAGA